MQLTHIKASHFMRYNHVDITLPEKGLFCIQGANESGKSTIGHLIYFALSGLGPKGEAAEQLINWESSQMKVSLSFMHNGEKYQLFRQVDRDGSNFSKLSKGEQVLAQGNSAITAALQRELGYNPPDLMRSFLITHRIVQKLVHEPSQAHVDYMLRLDHLNECGQEGRREADDLEKILSQELDKEKRTKDEQRAVGYDGVEERNAQSHLAELEGKFRQLQLDGENAHAELQCLRTLQEVIEKSGRSFPSKVDLENVETLERPITGSLTAFSQLSLREGRKGILDKSLSALRAILDFTRERSAFLLTYENHLEQLRKRIGLAENDHSQSTSLSARELHIKSDIVLAKKMTWRFCLAGGATMFFTLAMVATVALRSFLWHPQPNSLAWRFFHGGLGDELRLFLLKVIDHSGPLGCSAHALPWVIFAFLIVLDLVAAVVVLSYVKKIKIHRAELERVSLEKKSCTVSYHGLLGADIKEMLELSSAVEEFGSDDLKEAFFSFKNRHPLMAEKAFDVGQMIHHVREHLDGIVSHLKLELHQVENRSSAIHQQLHHVEETVLKAKTHLKECAQKKAMVELLGLELGKMSVQIASLKKDRAVKMFMAKLAEGTLISVRERLRRALTLAYKEIMPKITDDRYAAIRLGPNFEIEVFSEERGDFVPLHQLSSGTNDLFVLIFQMVLVQGFMDAREHDEHFLFLDEPLLAVDSTRYHKLMALLPTLCKGLKQIFICRPPVQEAEAYVITTQLNSRDLTVNFETPSPSLKSS